MLPERGDFSFQLHQKISQNSALNLTFPELMDHHSVEQNIVIPDDLEATGTWTDNTYILSPVRPLDANREYQIRLGSSALKQDGLPLGRDLTFTFIVTGAPSIVATVPTGSASSVATTTDIVLIFDRPVVPLSQVQDGKVSFKDWPVTIQPTVPGAWKWLGTTTATFVPVKSLRKATRYTVTAPKGIETVSGDARSRILF